MNRHAKPALSMSPRGLTLTEAVVAIGSAAVLLSVGTTVLAYKGGTSDSMYKLAEFGQAHACYANDWNERQWTALPDNAGRLQTTAAATPRPTVARAWCLVSDRPAQCGVTSSTAAACPETARPGPGFAR